MQCIQIIVLVDPGNKCSLHMARWSKVLGDHGGWFRGHRPTNRRTRTHRTMDAAPAGAGIGDPAGMHLAVKCTHNFSTGDSQSYKILLQPCILN